MSNDYWTGRFLTMADKAKTRNLPPGVGAPTNSDAATYAAVEQLIRIADALEEKKETIQVLEVYCPRCKETQDHIPMYNEDETTVAHLQCTWCSLYRKI